MAGFCTGYWSLGRMYWQEVTPEKDDIQGWDKDDD
jgi:hypothetical protein